MPDMELYYPPIQCLPPVNLAGRCTTQTISWNNALCCKYLSAKLPRYHPPLHRRSLQHQTSLDAPNKDNLHWAISPHTTKTRSVSQNYDAQGIYYCTSTALLSVERCHNNFWNGFRLWGLASHHAHDGDKNRTRILTTQYKLGLGCG